MPEPTKWTLDSLHEVFNSLRKADCAKYDERYESQIRDAEKLAKTLEDKFENVNEFRDALSDLGKDMMTRAEANPRFDAIKLQIETIERRLNFGEGSSSGSKDTRENRREEQKLNVSVVSLIVGVVGLLAGIMGSILVNMLRATGGP